MFQIFAKAGGMSQVEDDKAAEPQEDRERLQDRLDAQARELNLLRARFARYETALRGSHVSAFTQDQDLRYTSITNPLFGRSVEDMLGRSDEEVLPPDTAAAIVALKRAALASGQAKRGEFALADGPDLRWHDLHIEPLRDEADAVVGLSGASVDVTERKEGEAHLRLLLRELTHRSKNLLAVIQAMARQTAQHAGSTEGFLKQFGERLQALSASHDLLVRESWYGASVSELVRSQLAAFIDNSRAQVAFEGPEVALKPEAAQNLGLALHELAANAARFGALSVPEGRVSIVWRRDGAGGGNGVALDWREQFGPKVQARSKRGFGSMVIERNLPRALEADVNLEFAADGVRCHIVIPAQQIVAAR
jgi:PAS domain S-box-containing protein